MRQSPVRDFLQSSPLRTQAGCRCCVIYCYSKVFMVQATRLYNLICNSKLSLFLSEVLFRQFRCSLHEKKKKARSGGEKMSVKNVFLLIKL
jgi:hypothetical protein